MKEQQVCLHISRRNKNLPELIEERKMEWNCSAPDAVMRVFKEHNYYEITEGRALNGW